MSHSSLPFTTVPTFSHRAFHALFGIVGALVCAYVLFLGLTVFNIIHIKSAELSIKSISSEIGTLEQEYFSKANSIDLTFAKARGFTEATDAQYASRDNHVAFGTHLNPHEL